MTNRLLVVVLSIFIFKIFLFSKIAHAQTSGSPKKQNVGSRAQSSVAVKMNLPEGLKKYSYVDPKKIIPSKLLHEVLEYFDRHQDQITNKNYLSVIDYSKKSSANRFHIIDMKTGAVTSLHVAHGRGSDQAHSGFARSFSNVASSNATSLGYFIAAETYSGKHGYSLRLDGLSPSNSNARDRAIVIHGADYVRDANVIQGRSFGCPAVSLGQRDFVINSLKGGSLIYASN